MKPHATALLVTLAGLVACGSGLAIPGTAPRPPGAEGAPPRRQLTAEQLDALNPHEYEAAKYFDNEVRGWARDRKQNQTFTKVLDDRRAVVERLEAALAAEPAEEAFAVELERAQKELAQFEELVHRKSAQHEPQPVLDVYLKGLRCSTDADCITFAMGCCGETPVACNTGYGAVVRTGVDRLHEELGCEGGCGEPPPAVCDVGVCRVKGQEIGPWDPKACAIQVRFGEGLYETFRPELQAYADQRSSVTLAPVDRSAAPTLCLQIRDEKTTKAVFGAVVDRVDELQTGWIEVERYDGREVRLLPRSR